ncbi:hypothetical protein RPMA_13090 [Tardiphaga alba]|uniref:TonB-like protein n=2 Tax=Tardiphaga alba TaxID=340268 RepID=A0ABX8AJ27_9BRAD|nr:hypothetical protein [Tardiphaga alba]QUS42393.1 hypothetical protein RPMA_13090 [Tardiphaga alba]
MCVRLLILAMMAVASAAYAEPRRLRAGEAVPFSHAPCSLLDGPPCAPYICSLLDDAGPCMSEIDHPIGQNLQVTVMTVPPEDKADWYRRPEHDLDNLGDLFAALRSCWTPPARDVARAGMQMSVMFSFNRAGMPIAPPRVTFASQDAPKEARDIYLKAINDSLNGCLPMKLTKGLGGAIAGRPIMIRYVDNREPGEGAGPVR